MPHVSRNPNLDPVLFDIILFTPSATQVR